MVNVRSPRVEWLSPLIKQLKRSFGIGRSPLHYIQKDKEVQLSASLVLHGTGRWQMMQDHPNKLPSFLPEGRGLVDRSVHSSNNLRGGSTSGVVLFTIQKGKEVQLSLSQNVLLNWYL
jgi:hypothetical protein